MNDASIADEEGQSDTGVGSFVWLPSRKSLRTREDGTPIGSEAVHPSNAAELEDDDGERGSIVAPGVGIGKIWSSLPSPLPRFIEALASPKAPEVRFAAAPRDRPGTIGRGKSGGMHAFGQIRSNSLPLERLAF